MEFKHTSVLLDETIHGLNINPDGIYVDGTLGGGGHAYEIGKHLSPKGTLIGIDRDEAAIVAGGARVDAFPCKKILVRNNYSNIKEILTTLQVDKIHGAVLDLGVSSFQLDNPERGFSYMQDAPLDMRMDDQDKLTAENIVNEYEPKELLRIIKSYGEEKWAARIVEFMVRAREKERITTTFQLVDIIKSAIPAAARKDGPHPAKRTFQSIRIEVNNELGLLENAVRDFIHVLAPQGRLSIITFHSLEDRIVKDVFNEYANPCTCPKTIPYCVCAKVAQIKKISGKPIVANGEELENNPRARSAKLRIAERI